MSYKNVYMEQNKMKDKYFTKTSSCLLDKEVKIYYNNLRRKCENKQMWFTSNKGVRLMIGTEYLFTIVYILLYALIGITIIAIALIIAIVVILSKSE